jgi:hypothetical protein
MLDTNFKLSVLEITLFLSGALVLGISIHSFIAGRRIPKVKKGKKNKNNLEDVEWELKYLSEMELKEKEISTLRKRLQALKENANIFSIEIEELRQRKYKFEEIKEKLEQKIMNKDNVRIMMTGQKTGTLVRV